MRIVIFGGSFNPLTKGHMEIIEELSKRFDEVHVLPSYNHILKDVDVPFYHRFEMLKEVYNDPSSNIFISNEEEYNEDGTTYNLVSNISKHYSKEDKFFICIGEDNAIGIDRWKYNEKLRDEYNFLVFGRDGEHRDGWYKESPNEFIEFEFNVSSSLFRETLDKEIVDEKVYRYIKENNLYGVNDI